jgi:hypothetical protein
LAVPPPPQVAGEVHVPQLSVPPQPSLMDPQLSPCAAHVVGVHVPPPHTLAVPPPPQVAGEVQVPQLSVPPQPSATDPQFLPSAEHVVGVQLPQPADALTEMPVAAASLDLSVE